MNTESNETGDGLKSGGGKGKSGESRRGGNAGGAKTESLLSKLKSMLKSGFLEAGSGRFLNGSLFQVLSAMSMR